MTNVNPPLVSGLEEVMEEYLVCLTVMASAAN
jgi:hypothetical protein